MSLFFFVPLLIFFSLFTFYHIYHSGLAMGLYQSLLFWSMYVLCIPAAHGSVWLGGPLSYVLHRRFFAEPYCWIAAALLNIVSLIIAPQVYHSTIFTYLLFRILTMPRYWIILIVAALGTWFRFLCRDYHSASQRRLIGISRQIILLLGVFLFVYMTHYDFIVMINSFATG